MPIVADGVTDDAPAINAALADPTVDVLQLTGGVHAAGSAVIIPTGKSLFGSGRLRTTIKALPTFDRLVSINGVVATEEQAHAISVADLLIDGSKVGNTGFDADRIQGLMVLQSQRFSVRRVDILDVSGYGHFCRGIPGDPNAIPASGVYDDCVVAGAQICYEQMACDGVVINNCRALPGDGDISRTNHAHCVAGSRNITYRDFIGRGPASAGVELTADVGPALDRISFFNSIIEVLEESSPGQIGQGFVSDGTLGLTNLLISNSRIVAIGAAGLNLINTTGKIDGSYIEGHNIGMILHNSTLHGSDSDVFGIGLASNPHAYGISGGAELNWNGGLIAAVPGVGGNANPYTSNVIVTPTTRVNPKGGGYYLPRILPGNHGNGDTPPITIGTPQAQPWKFPIMSGRRYRLVVLGAVQQSNAAQGIKIGLRSTVAAKARGAMSIGTTQASISAIGAFGIANSFVLVPTVPVANTDQIFRADIIIVALANGEASIDIASTQTGSQALITENSGLIVLEI